MRTVFFGTPAFAAEILEFLVNKTQVLAVVSRPDQAVGRKRRLQPTAVKQAALQHKLPIYQPEKASSPDFIEEIKVFEPDLFIVVAYGEIMSTALLNVPKIASINIHASLLPKYRGAAPIQRCIMNGEATSGITIMHMAKALDAGDIVSQESIPLSLESSFEEVENNLKQLSKKLIWKAMQDFEKGTACRIPQNEALATYAKKILPEDQELTLSNEAINIHNQVRALSPKPGAWLPAHFKGEQIRLKILETYPIDKSDIPPRKHKIQEGEWIVGTANGALKLKKIQLPGKKPLHTADFLRGYPVSELIFTEN
jgi:methionyl-tRNA formyltransferase